MRTLPGSICTLYFLALLVPLQTAKQTTKKPSSAPVKISTTCPDPEAKAACKSFQEMVEAKDKDILSLVGGDSEFSYACFLKKDDEFFVISFTQNRSKVFWNQLQKDGNELIDPFEIFQYAKFKNGVTDDYKYLILSWHKMRDAPYDEARGDAVEKAESDKPAHGFITESEITLVYSFKNAGGENTDVNLQIRRSTLKYVMTFTVEKEHLQFSELGGCAKLASPKG